MAKGEFITEKTFKAAKILIASGAKNKEVAEYLGISPTTVTRIKQSETYEEFKSVKKANAYMAKKAAEAKAAEKKEEEKPVTQVVEHRQTVTVQATHYMMEEMKAQTELLKTISAKLAFIVEQLA